MVRLPPLSKQGAKEKILLALRDDMDMASGELDEDELFERIFATRFPINAASRELLSEALAELMADGLIENYVTENEAE